MRDKLVDQLIKHEALKLKPYYCPAGKLTIGVGRNLEDKGISQKEAVFLLKNDIDECIADLEELFKEKFDSFPDQVKMVLIDMRFNLGAAGFRSFRKMIKAVNESDFDKASKEMKDSNWYSQVGKRAEILVERPLHNLPKIVTSGQALKTLSGCYLRPNQI